MASNARQRSPAARRKRAATRGSRLRRVDCSDPGIARVRRGRGFGYRDEEGTRIEDEPTLERIRALAIPPAWRQVWICADPLGHIQATGTDDAGRKQYLYHRRWRERRDRAKFERMLEFGAGLPDLRRRVERDLGGRGLSRSRVLACLVRLLDLGLFRVGSAEYASENGTFGLTTLRRRHLSFDRGRARFDYRAKGSQRVVQEIADEPAVAVLRSLKRRRSGGAQLFAFYEGRAWHRIDADTLNEYLKRQVGEAASAKDFRTWNATVLAALSLARQIPAGERPPRAARQRAIRTAIEQVAEQLSNTPAVCRASYVDPRLLERVMADIGTLDPVRTAAERPAGRARFADRERIEAAVLELLD